MNRPFADSSKPLLLCVEDEPDLREDLVDELRAAGYTVVSASDGEDALACLNSIVPELILCDITMPGMDGYELLRIVRETRPDLATVPFIFLTAQAGPEQIVQGKLAGADDYLVKPINFDLMLATIACRMGQISRVQNKFLSQRSQPAEQRSAPTPKGLRHAEQALDFITSGVLVLDQHGNISVANQAARRLTRAVERPTLDDLAGVSPRDIQRLQKLVDAGLAASRAGADYMDGLAIARGDGQPDLLTTVCSLSADRRADEIEPIAAIFLSDMSRHAPPPTEALHALFGLTPTEAQVAWAFTEGKRADEIAATFRISPTTVAFHKRNIFQKTRTHRQADLIAVMLSLPVPQRRVAGDLDKTQSR